MKMKRSAPVPRPVVRKLPPKLKINASIARSRSSRAQDDDDYYDAPEPNMRLSHAFVVVLVLHVIAVGGVFAFNSIKSNQRPGVASAAASEASVQPEAVAAAATVPRSGVIAPPASLPATQRPSAQVAETSTPAHATTAQSPAASGTTHEVQSGETLTRIASKYSVSVAALQEANAIDDPTKIRIGTLLVIPQNSRAAEPARAAPAVVTSQTAAPATATTAPKPAAATANAPASNIRASGEIYEVAKGDNPVSIAKKLNVSYSDLLALNKIDDPRRLQIGQKLKIPE
jgi:LysM repeat protein